MLALGCRIYTIDPSQQLLHDIAGSRLWVQRLLERAVHHGDGAFGYTLLPEALRKIPALIKLPFAADACTPVEP